MFKKTHCLALGLCLSAVCMRGALAQDSTATDPADTLVVTATATPLSLRDIGSAVTVIDRETIEARQVRFVSELLRSVPGFSVSQSGGVGAQTQVRVRGAESNHLLVLIDGVEANDPASGDEFRFELLSTSQIERIEIVRGPQSALWGSEALAGVINIITRKDGAEAAGTLNIEAGSNSTRLVDASYGSGFSNGRVDIGLALQDTDGINTSRTGPEEDGSELATLTAGVTLQPGFGLELYANGRYTDAETEFDPTDFFVTGLPVDGDRRFDAHQLAAALGARWRSTDDRWRQSLALEWTDTDNENFSDGENLTGSTADRRLVRYRLTRNESRYSWVFGVDNEKARFTNFDRGAFVVPGGAFDPNQSQELSVTGWVAEYTDRHIDDTVITLGVRYDRNSDFDDIVSGRLSAVYSFNDAHRVRASAGRGTKAPTFTERFGFFPNSFVGNPALEPETSDSWELGLISSWPGLRAETELTYFDQRLENEVNGFVFDPAAGLFTAANENATSDRRGAEVAVRLQPDTALTLFANYTYVDATQAGPGGVTVVDEVRRPRHSGTLGLDWVGMNERLRVYAVADYNGEQIDQFFPPFPQPSQFVTLDDYWLVDLTANWTLTEAISLYARLSNALDEEYENVFGFATPGRQVFFGLRGRFGGR